MFRDSIVPGNDSPPRRRFGPADAKKHTGLTILLVEDERAVREICATLLTMGGYSVLQAGDGAEAKAVSAKHDGPIHILVVDVVLPDVSGPELARRLAAQNPRLRVLFVSGYPEEIVELDSWTSDGVGFLAKPFDCEGLLSAIDCLLTTYKRSESD